MTSNKGRLVWLPEDEIINAILPAVTRFLEVSRRLAQIDPKEGDLQNHSMIIARDVASVLFTELPPFEWSEEQIREAVYAYDDNDRDVTTRDKIVAALNAARVPELLARVQRLEEALRPFAFFIDQFDRQPLRGQDDAFYGLHYGTDFEATLRLSDMRIARAALENKL